MARRVLLQAAVTEQCRNPTASPSRLMSPGCCWVSSPDAPPDAGVHIGRLRTHSGIVSAARSHLASFDCTRSRFALRPRTPLQSTAVLLQCCRHRILEQYSDDLKWRGFPVLDENGEGLKHSRPRA